MAHSIKTSASARRRRTEHAGTHRGGQSMGLLLSEATIAEPANIEQSVCDLARAGYGMFRLMLRKTHFTHRLAQVVQAVGRAVRAALADGIRVVLDCEPHRAR